MTLHPVLAAKLNEAMTVGTPHDATRRDAALPPVPGKVHSIIGMRRAGKTTFLRQLQADRRCLQPPEQAVYISFDDDRLAGIGVDQLGAMLEEYYRIHPGLRGQETVAWYFDEIQLVPGWDRFARRVLDTERCELVVSGSSAQMLSREVHTSLRGRGMETVITPFSFREFLRHRGEEPAVEPQRWTPADRSLVEGRLRDFLAEGGFPEAQGLGLGLRIELLQGYVDTVLFRDVVERYAVSQVAALRWIVRHCLRTPAGAFSVHRLHLDLKAQGLGVGRELVHDLLDHLTDAFLLGTLALATESERKRNSNPRKIYPADPGLVRAFDASGRANVGRSLETAVFNELQRRGADMGYVRGERGWEVDFLARYVDGREELLQVCADTSDGTVLEREVRALQDAQREHPRAVLRLIILDRDSGPRGGLPGIEILPASDWLLEER